MEELVVGALEDESNQMTTNDIDEERNGNFIDQEASQNDNNHILQDKY